MSRRAGTIFQHGVKVIMYSIMRWFSLHPLKSCWLLDRWSLPLLWHLSDISAICNFWPELLFLVGGGSADPWPGLLEPWKMSCSKWIHAVENQRCRTLRASTLGTLRNRRNLSPPLPCRSISHPVDPLTLPQCYTSFVNYPRRAIKSSLISSYRLLNKSKWSCVLQALFWYSFRYFLFSYCFSPFGGLLVDALHKSTPWRCGWSDFAAVVRL